MRRSSLTAGTNQAVSGSGGWAATAKPNFAGAIAVSSCQSAPAFSRAEHAVVVLAPHDLGVRGAARQAVDVLRDRRLALLRRHVFVATCRG